MAVDAEVTIAQSIVPADEELLARISTPLLSALFAAVGEIYGIAPLNILKNHPKGRQRGREAHVRAQQTVIYLLSTDYNQMPKDIARVFVLELRVMTARCKGIMKLAQLGGEFMENVAKVRAKLYKSVSLPK
jgi:hypothetical protein